MTYLSLIGLCGALFVFAISPGPGVFATVARSMASGFRSAVSVVSGIILGDILYLMFALFGLAFVAKALGEFFIIVKICGGAYLVWLGLNIWFSKPGTRHIGTLDKKRSKTENFISGLLITLSNPKVILFYCGFLPAFLDIPSLTSFDMVLIVGMVVIILTVVLTSYAYLASRATRLFSSVTAVKRLNKISGGLMMAAGVTIASRSSY